MSSRREYGSVIVLILKALKEHGPLTRKELEIYSGSCTTACASTLNRLCKDSPVVGQERIHICGWVQEGTRYARYAIGPGENVPPPYPKRVHCRTHKTERVRIQETAIPNGSSKLNREEPWYPPAPGADLNSAWLASFRSRHNGEVVK